MWPPEHRLCVRLWTFLCPVTCSDGEMHLHQLGVHVCGFQTSPYGIEWMRFDPHCPVPEIVKTVPHLAFAVDNLDAALEGKQILIAPNSPSRGVRVAFILDDGAPIELLEFDGPDVPGIRTSSPDC